MSRPYVIHKHSNIEDANDAAGAHGSHLELCFGKAHASTDAFAVSKGLEACRIPNLPRWAALQPPLRLEAVPSVLPLLNLPDGPHQPKLQPPPLPASLAPIRSRGQASHWSGLQMECIPQCSWECIPLLLRQQLYLFDPAEAD